MFMKTQGSLSFVLAAPPAHRALSKSVMEKAGWGRQSCHAENSGTCV